MLKFTKFAKVLAAAAVAAAAACTGVSTSDTDDGARCLFTIPGSHANDPVPSPDGRYRAFWENATDHVNNIFERYVAKYDLETQEHTRLYGGIDYNPYDFAYSPDGKYIAYNEGDDVYIIPAAGGEPIQITSGEGICYVRCWNPDAQSVVYSVIGYYPFRLMEKNVYTMEKRVLLTDDERTFWDAHYSPDGALMVTSMPSGFDSEGSMENEIYDTSTWEKIETLSTSSKAGPWSPDGKYILLLHSNPNGDGNLLSAYNTETGDVVPITKPRDISHGSWSADGRAIYFDVDAYVEKFTGIYVIEAPI